MSKVVKFPIERTNCKPALLTPCDADIIIFPGVRIERREFNLADRHPKIGRSSQTKALLKTPNQ